MGEPVQLREATRDPDDLYGDSTVFFLEIRVRRNGAMSVGGHIHEEAYALSVLDAAKQTIKNHNARARMAGGSAVIVPAHDTPWGKEVA
jgi:hypothetical protein